MSDLITKPEAVEGPKVGLLTRLVGVIFSPRDAYTAVVARPRALGAILVAAALISVALGLFLSSEAGQSAWVDQQIGARQMSPEQVATLERIAPYIGYAIPVLMLVFVPIGCAIYAGLAMGIFGVFMGGEATFKQAYAVVAHSLIIGAIQQLVSTPVQYLQGSMLSPTRLGVFLPMLPDEGFFTSLFNMVDLFQLWSLINLSIGLAVLYKRRTGSVAAVTLSIYAVAVLAIAAIRAF